MEKLDFITEPVALTIGNFDGVHIGHQHLINVTLQKAEQLHIKSAVMSFDPLPARFYGASIPVVTLTDEKEEFLAALKIDFFHLAAFTKEFASLPAETFLESYLLPKINVKALVVGADFHFGKNAKGDTALLQEFCATKGINFTVVERISENRQMISSSLLRELILTSPLEIMPRFLGRDFSVSGVVTRGDRIGATLGFPTANILVPREKILPPKGVYAGYVLFDGAEYKAMMYLGSRPTLDADGEKRLEAHLKGYTGGDLYGKRLTVYFKRFMREEKKFSALSELKSQLELDFQRI